jgi:hypothetical protein
MVTCHMEITGFNEGMRTEIYIICNVYIYIYMCVCVCVCVCVAAITHTDRSLNICRWL